MMTIYTRTVLALALCPWTDFPIFFGTGLSFASSFRDLQALFSDSLTDVAHSRGFD